MWVDIEGNSRFAGQTQSSQVEKALHCIISTDVRFLQISDFDGALWERFVAIANSVQPCWYLRLLRNSSSMSMNLKFLFVRFNLSEKALLVVLDMETFFFFFEN